MDKAIAIDDQLTRPHINAQATTLIGQARSWLEQWRKRGPLTTLDEHAKAVEGRKTLGQAKRQLAEIEKSHVAPYKAQIDAIRSFFQGAEESIAEAVKIADQRILTFEREEKQRREEEERKAQAVRLAEAKRLREEAEAKAREQREREAKALEEAMALEAAGQIDQADEVMAQTIEAAREAAVDLETANLLAEVVASAPIHTNAAPLARAGTKRTKHYSVKIVDEKAIVTAWLAGNLPSIAVEVNLQYFNQQARSLKEAFAVPGLVLVIAERVGG